MLSTIRLARLRVHCTSKLFALILGLLATMIYDLSMYLAPFSQLPVHDSLYGVDCVVL